VKEGPYIPQESGVFLEVFKATAVGDALQINIGNGRHGYRLAGPKFGASGSQLLKRVRLSERDAEAIRGYLAEVTDV
jgi:hypothetical protein